MQASPIETEYNEEEQLRIVVDSAHIEIDFLMFGILIKWNKKCFYCILKNWNFQWFFSKLSSKLGFSLYFKLYFVIFFHIFSIVSRRKRSTEHGITDYDALLNAIKDIIINKRSKKSTAAAYKISRINLLRYVAKFTTEILIFWQMCRYML